MGLSKADNLLVVGECKFWKNPVGVNVLFELEQKIAFINWNKTENRKVVFVIFAINGFSEELITMSKSRSDVMLI